MSASSLLSLTAGLAVGWLLHVVYARQMGAGLRAPTLLREDARPPAEVQRLERELARMRLECAGASAPAVGRIGARPPPPPPPPLEASDCRDVRARLATAERKLALLTAPGCQTRCDKRCGLYDDCKGEAWVCVDLYGLMLGRRNELSDRPLEKGNMRHTSAAGRARYSPYFWDSLCFLKLDEPAKARVRAAVLSGLGAMRGVPASRVDLSRPLHHYAGAYTPAQGRAFKAAIEVAIDQRVGSIGRQVRWDLPGSKFSPRRWTRRGAPFDCCTAVGQDLHAWGTT